MSISPTSSSNYSPRLSQDYTSRPFIRHERPGMQHGILPGGCFPSPAPQQSPIKQMLGLMQEFMKTMQQVLGALVSQLGGQQGPDCKALEGQQGAQQAPQAPAEEKKGGGIFDTIKNIGGSLLDKGLSFLKDTFLGGGSGGGGGILGSIGGILGKLF